MVHETFSADQIYQRQQAFESMEQRLSRQHLRLPRDENKQRTKYRLCTRPVWPGKEALLGVPPFGGRFAVDYILPRTAKMARAAPATVVLRYGVFNRCKSTSGNVYRNKISAAERPTHLLREQRCTGEHNGKGPPEPRRIAELERTLTDLVR